MTAPASLIAMATDAHSLMVAADQNCKAHAGIRNACIVRMVDEYGIGLADVATLTGIKDSVCRNVYYRQKGKTQ